MYSIIVYIFDLNSYTLMKGRYMMFKRYIKMREQFVTDMDVINRRGIEIHIQMYM